MKDSKEKLINNICDYLNHKYKESFVEYVDDNFIVNGTDKEQMEAVRTEIEEMLEYSTKNKL